MHLAVAGDFRVEGTLLSGIELHDLSTLPLDTAAGSLPPSPLTGLEIGLAELRYDIAPLLRRDYLGAVRLVRLHNIEADLDLPPKREDADEQIKDSDPSDPDSDPLAVLWKALEIPYDIDNVTVHISRVGKNVVTVEGLQLKLLPETDGQLGFARLKIGESIERTEISAPLTVSEDQLTLGRFEPVDGLAIEQLTLNRSGNEQLTALLDIAGGRLSVGLQRDRTLHAELRDGSIDLGSLTRQFGGNKAISSGSVGALNVLFSGDFKQPASWTSEGRLAATGLTFPGQSLDKATLGFDIRDGILSATLIALRSGATADLSVQSDISSAESPAEIIELPLSAQLDVEAEAVDNFIPPAQRQKIPVTGAAMLTAQASMTPKPWKLDEGSTATLSSDSLQWDGNSLQSLTLDVTAEPDNHFATDLQLALDGDNRVAVNGVIGIGQLDYRADVDASIEANAKLSGLLASFGFQKALAGNVELTWKGKGILKPSDPATSPAHEGQGTISAAEIRIAEGRAIESLNLKIEHSPQSIRIDELELSSGDLSLSADGSYDLESHLVDVPSLSIRRNQQSLASGSVKLPYDPAAFKDKGIVGFFEQQGEIDIDFQSADLRLEELIAMTGKESPVQGGITAMIDLRGTPPQLQGGASVRAVDLKASAAPDVPPGDFAIDLAIADQRIDLSGRFSHPQIEPLTIDGSLPFTPEAWTSGESEISNAPIQLQAKMAPSSLDFLRSYVPGIEKIEATAALDVLVEGTVGKPEPRGTLKLDIEEFHMANRNIPSVHNGRVELSAEGRSIRIDTFEALVSGGQVKLAGSVAFPTDSAGPQLDLTLTAREALIARSPDYNVRADTDLKLVGPWSAAALSGEIALVNSRFIKSIDILPISMPGRNRSDLPDVEKRPPAVKVPPNLDFGLEIAPFKDWTIDIKIITRDPFEVRGNLARIDAVSDLRITGTGAKPVPNGRIYITEGRLTLPFSKVQIQKGEVTFNEATGFNGEIDLQATAEVRQYNISIYLYDRLLNPKNVLTSDPPLPNEDIISLLAAGTTREELTGGSGSVAASRAALLFLKKLRSDDIDPDDDPNFLEQLNERTTLDIGQTDPRTGEQTVAGRIRLFRQFFLVANVSAEGEYRGLLKYIFQFR